MPTILTDSAVHPADARARELLLDPLRALEEELGRELTVRASSATPSEPQERVLETWAWNERIAVPIAGEDLALAARDLLERLRRAHASGMRDALDVLDYVERHRRFTRAGWAQDELRFAYRQTRREALARLALTGRRGILLLDEETEELSLLFSLPGGRHGLVSESKLSFEDFATGAAESIEIAFVDEAGAIQGQEVATVPVCPPLGRIEDALQELLARDTPVVLGRNPESGLPFVAHRADQDAVEVWEYVVHSEEIVPERIAGFPPVIAITREHHDPPAWAHILMCPKCNADLPWRSDELRCACGARYPVAGGRPDFLAADPASPTPHPAEVWAPNPKQKVLLYFLRKYARGIVLDCGAGNSAFRAPNLVNLEVFPFDSVNVVADGQRLPFRAGSIDAVVSAAVLEHVPNPFEYCSELWRVLKVGGEVRIDSAFLQPYHGCPDHYFGTTRSGLIEAARKFRPVGVGVASGQTPFVALQTWLHAYETALPDDEARNAFRRMTVADLMSVANAVAPAAITVAARNAHRIAAGVYLHGVKR